MHADYSTGHAYSLCMNDAAGTATVIEVTGAAPVTVADVTGALRGGSVLPGQTTHCSATKHMYIGASLGGAGKDVVVAVDLVAGRVDATTQLTVALFDALCVGVAGGRRGGEFGGRALPWVNGGVPPAAIAASDTALQCLPPHAHFALTPTPISQLGHVRRFRRYWRRFVCARRRPEGQ